MSYTPQDYHAYLLRLFQVVEEGQSVWRVSLQEPGSEQFQKFASIQEFVEFIMNKTEQTAHYTFHHQLVESKEHETTILEIKLVITSSAGED